MSLCDCDFYVIISLTNNVYSESRCIFYYFITGHIKLRESCSDCFCVEYSDIYQKVIRSVLAMSSVQHNFCVCKVFTTVIRNVYFLTSLLAKWP